MATVKKDTEYKKVIIEHANPSVETPAGYVGGNNIIENGKHVIKHYRFQVGEEVELPVTFIKELKSRKHVLSIETENTKAKSVAVYNIKEVK